MWITSCHPGQHSLSLQLTVCVSVSIWGKLTRKRCLTSLIIREIKIETTIRYYYTSIRMKNVNNVRARIQSNRNSHALLVGLKNVTDFREQFDSFL